jgi:hypothetical protein
MKSTTIARKLLLCFITLLALLTVLSVVAFSALGAIESRPGQTAIVALKNFAPTGHCNAGTGNLRTSWRRRRLFAFGKDRGQRTSAPATGR